MTDPQRNTPRCSNCRSSVEEWTIIGGRLLCWECAEHGNLFSLNPIPEFIKMTKMGLTATQIFDWWMVEKEELAEREWAETRDVEAQAVNEKVNKVAEVLGDGQTQVQDVTVDQSQTSSTPLTDLDGIGETMAERLHNRGYESVEDLTGISRTELLAVDGISDGKAERILNEVA